MRRKKPVALRGLKNDDIVWSRERATYFFLDCLPRWRYQWFRRVDDRFSNVYGHCANTAYWLRWVDNSPRA